MSLCNELRQSCVYEQKAELMYLEKIDWKGIRDIRSQMLKVEVNNV